MDKPVNVYGKFLRKDDPLLGVDNAFKKFPDAAEPSTDSPSLLEIFLQIVRHLCCIK